jgi:hypothetical protein
MMWLEQSWFAKILCNTLFDSSPCEQSNNTYSGGFKLIIKLLIYSTIKIWSNCNLGGEGIGGFY